MKRLLLALALLAPAAALAKGHKKPSDGVEIWPPPDPATTGQEPQPTKPEPAPKQAEPVDAGDPYALDPSLEAPAPAPRRAHPRDDGDPGRGDGRAKAGAPAAEDACGDAFDDCKEDCTIAHTNDDDLHVKGKLPLVKCIGACQRTYDHCAERRDNGFDD